MDEQIFVSYDPKTDQWFLVKPFIFEFRCKQIEIPINFAFKASIPRPLWNWIGPNDLGMTPPLIHDYLYDNKGIIEDRFGQIIEYTRKDADVEFLRRMKLLHIPYITRNAAYLAVRLLGWTYWET